MTILPDRKIKHRIGITLETEVLKLIHIQWKNSAILLVCSFSARNVLAHPSYSKKKKNIISLYRSTGLDLKFGEHNMNYSQWLFERENSHHSDDFKELTGSKKITHRPFVLPALGRKEGKRHRCLFKTVNQAKLQSDTTALM